MQQTVSDAAARRLDPERLRSITENFMASKGSLGFAAFGAALAAQQMIDVYWPRSSWMYLVAIALVLGAVLFWFVYIPRYDASRFGWVQHKRPAASTPKAVSVALLIIFGALFTMWIGADLLQHFAPAPVNYLTLLQSVGFFCLILVVAFTARSRSTVRLTIWAALVAIQGLVAVLPLWFSLSPRQMLLWKALNAGSLGILIMVMGFSNHIAMVRMLPKRVEEDDHD